MFKAANFRRNFFVFTIPVLLILSLFFITQSNWFSKYPTQLSVGITIDLLFLIPLVYFFLIRKKEIPKITVLSLFIVGLVTASYILPENHQLLLSQVKTYFFPVVELGILTFLFIKIRKLGNNSKI